MGMPQFSKNEYFIILESEFCNFTILIPFLFYAIIPLQCTGPDHTFRKNWSLVNNGLCILLLFNLIICNGFLKPIQEVCNSGVYSRISFLSASDAPANNSNKNFFTRFVSSNHWAARITLTRIFACFSSTDHSISDCVTTGSIIIAANFSCHMRHCNFSEFFSYQSSWL